MANLYEAETELSLGNNVIVTQMTQAINWARKYSFFIYPFITACCGMEFMSVAGPRYDLDRFGAAFPRSASGGLINGRGNDQPQAGAHPGQGL